MPNAQRNKHKPNKEAAEIFRLYDDGLTDKEIAKRLCGASPESEFLFGAVRSLGTAPAGTCLVEQVWESGKAEAVQERERARHTRAKGAELMSLYRRGKMWWYKFSFAGQVVRESSKSESRTVAKEAERSRRRELEEVLSNRISRPRTAQLFSGAAETWLQTKIAHLSPRSVIIERANLKHINPYFGKMLLCDVAADDIARYQAERLEKGAAPKTVNLEVGTLRAILCKNRLWASIQPEVRMLRASENIGRAISREEEAALLEACRASRSRSLYPAVLIALNTCMRYSELRQRFVRLFAVGSTTCGTLAVLECLRRVCRFQW